MSIRAIIQPLIENGLATEESFQGLLPREVDQLETLLNVSFPGVYREYLLTMGRRDGGIFRGIHTFPHFPDLRQWAEELLEEVESEFQLPDDAVVFEMHQGCAFRYFRLGEGDDPPAYGYQEFDSDSAVDADSFSGYLRDYVQTYIAFAERPLRDRPEDEAR
jgi:hypothetical protein